MINSFWHVVCGPESVPSKLKVCAGVEKVNLLQLFIQGIFTLVEKTHKEPATTVKCPKCQIKVRTREHRAGDNQLPWETGDIFTRSDNSFGLGKMRRNCSS